MTELTELERRAETLDRIIPFLIKDPDENYLSNISVWRKNILKSAVRNQWELRKLYQFSRSRMPKRVVDLSTPDPEQRGATHKRSWGLSSKSEVSAMKSEHWDKGYLQISGFSPHRKDVLLRDLKRDRIYLKYLLEDEGTRMMFLRNMKEEDTKTLSHYSRIWLEALLANFLSESKRIRAYIVMALNYLEGQCLTNDKLDFWHSLQRLVSTHYSDSSSRKLTEELQKELVYFLKHLKVLNKYVESKRYRKVIGMGNYLLSKLKRQNMREFRRMKLCIICDLLDTVGGAYLATRMFSEGLDYFAEEFNVGKKQHLPNAIFRSLDNIGLLFACKGEYENAVSVWTKRLSSLETDIERTWLNQAVAQCYAYLGNHHKSLEYAKNSLSYAKKCKSVSWEICAQLLMAHNYCRLDTTSHMATKQNLYAALDCLYNAFIGAACYGDNKVRGMVTALFIQVEDRLASCPGDIAKPGESRNQRCLTSMTKHLASVLETTEAYNLGNTNASNNVNERNRIKRSRLRKNNVRKQALSGLRCLLDGAPPPVRSASLNSSNHIRESTRLCIAPLLTTPSMETNTSAVSECSRVHSPWPVSTSAPAPWVEDVNSQCSRDDEENIEEIRKRKAKRPKTRKLARRKRARRSKLASTQTEFATPSDPRCHAAANANRNPPVSQPSSDVHQAPRTKSRVGKKQSASLTSLGRRRAIKVKQVLGDSPSVTFASTDPRRNLKTEVNKILTVPQSSASTRRGNKAKVSTGKEPSVSSTLCESRRGAKAKPVEGKIPKLPTESNDPRRKLKTNPKAIKSSHPSSTMELEMGTAPSLSVRFSVPEPETTPTPTRSADSHLSPSLKSSDPRPLAKAKPATVKSPNHSQPSSSSRHCSKPSFAEEWMSLPFFTSVRGGNGGDSEVKTGRDIQSQTLSTKTRETKKKGQFRRRRGDIRRKRENVDTVGNRRRNPNIPRKVQKVGSRRKEDTDRRKMEGEGHAGTGKRRDCQNLDFWPLESVLFRSARKSQDVRSAVERYRKEDSEKHSPSQPSTSTEVPTQGTTCDSPEISDHREFVRIPSHHLLSEVSSQPERSEEEGGGATDSDVTWEDIPEDEDISLSKLSPSQEE